MTAHFAIPATTVVLCGLLRESLETAWQGFIPPPVLAEPPPRQQPAPQRENQAPPPEPLALHLFLHHAGPNPAWRNMHEPQTGPDGRRIVAAPVVLDLHYLLAATGPALEREMLLGLGIHALTRAAIVPRDKVQAILGQLQVPAQPTTPIESLGNEPLFDPLHQPEQITVTQNPVDFDLSTKLWSALQAPLRPSASFLVTTVFLHLDEAVPPARLVEALRLAAHPDPDRKRVLPPPEPEEDEA